MLSFDNLFSWPILKLNIMWEALIRKKHHLIILWDNGPVGKGMVKHCSLSGGSEFSLWNWQQDPTVETSQEILSY